MSPIGVGRLVHRRRQRAERGGPYGPLTQHPVPLKVSLPREPIPVFGRAVVRLLVAVLHVHYGVLLVGVVLFVRRVVLGAARGRNPGAGRGSLGPGVGQKGRDAEADVTVFAGAELLLSRGFVRQVLHRFSAFGRLVQVQILDSHTLATVSLVLEHGREKLAVSPRK